MAKWENGERDIENFEMEQEKGDILRKMAETMEMEERVTCEEELMQEGAEAESETKINCEEDAAQNDPEIENERNEEEEEIETDMEKDAGKGKEKKSFFGKKKEKKDKKDLEIEELTDKYKRTLAEFDNFRKRTEKEKTQMYEIGAKDIIEKILPVLDNFERGFASISEEEKATPFAEGMEKVYKQFVKTLEDMGVTPIEAVGKEFNPDFHNAVMRGEDEELGENIISDEFQKGYLYRDHVVRHSMVKVVNC